MGAVPKRRISKGRKGRRRAHNAIKVKTCYKNALNVATVKRSHFECQYCGYYNKSK